MFCFDLLGLRILHNGVEKPEARKNVPILQSKIII